MFAKAIAHEGFSLVEVLELCTEHATTRNELKGSMLVKMAESEGHKLGLLKNERERKEFSVKYAGDVQSHVLEMKPPVFVEPQDDHNLIKPVGFIISGSAGERVQSSAGMLCQAALRCGLEVTQKNDNPVTQGSGFSLSEVIISPEEINYTGVSEADFVVIVSDEGLRELKAQDIYQRISDKTVFVVDESIEPDEVSSKVIKLPLRKLCGGDKSSLGAIDYVIRKYSLFSREIFKTLLEKKFGDYSKIFKGEFYNL
jgi:2-oxoglutarate/2-oxoacid ferredoxin oxidoreductase subunit beta